jgi:hypothetical protein
MFAANSTQDPQQRSQPQLSLNYASLGTQPLESADEEQQRVVPLLVLNVYFGGQSLKIP